MLMGQRRGKKRKGGKEGWRKARGEEEGVRGEEQEEGGRMDQGCKQRKKEEKILNSEAPGPKAANQRFEF